MYVIAPLEHCVLPRLNILLFPSSMEKFKATQVANDIRDEDHAGDAEVVIIDAFSEEEEKFFEALGGGSSDAIPEEASDEITDEVL